MTSLRLALTSTAAALLIAVGSFAPALADGHNRKVRIIGQVSEVNPAANTMSVKTAEGVTTVAVTGFTEFELENKMGPFDYDKDVPFSEVKIGDWVKVKAIPDAQGKLIADDVDIRRQ